MPAASNPRELPATSSPANDNESTGQFAIDPLRRDTMLPPPDQDVAVLTLEELGGVAVEAAQERPRSLPPPPPAAATASGVFSRETKQALDSIEANPLQAASLRSTPVERAVLEIEDLSLRLDDPQAFHNPYFASSLIPPSRPAVSLRTVGLFVGGALVISAVAAWILLAPQAQRAPAQSPIAKAPVAAKQVALVAPAAKAQAPSAAPAVPSTPTAPVATGQTAPAETISPVARVAKKEAPSAKPAVTTLAPAADVVEPAAAAASEAISAAPTSEAAPGATAVIPGAATVEAVAPVQAVEAAAPSAALPTTPDRAAVVAAFDQLRGELEQCAADRHGTAEVRATIAGTGKVSYALVAGAFAGTPEGSCMARVIRTQGNFPAFSQPNLKLVYPLAF